MLSEVLRDQNPWWSDPSRRPAPLPFRRPFEQRLRETLGRADRRALLVVGPRQVGKTTALRQAVAAMLDAGWPAGNITYCDFSDDRLALAVPSPREVADVLPPSADPEKQRALIFDELGRAPTWAEWLKQAVDAGGARVVATDSAATLLKAGGRESGLGRWDELYVEGLTYREFLGVQALPGESAEGVARRTPGAFERYLARGGYPEHVFGESVSEVRQRIRLDVVERAILRDLLRLDLDLERVLRLFLLLVEEAGALVDLAQIGKALGADRRSMEKWSSHLEDTMLVRRLEPLAASAGKRLRARARSKVYPFDHGIIMAFSPALNPGDDPRVRGHAMEALVFRHLRELTRELWFYREDDDLEVDFVAGFRGQLVAVEVTTSADVPRRKLARCRSASERIGARPVIVHGGYMQGEVEGVSLVPVERFALAPEAALEEGP